MIGRYETNRSFSLMPNEFGDRRFSLESIRLVNIVDSLHTKIQPLNETTIKRRQSGVKLIAVIPSDCPLKTATQSPLITSTTYTNRSEQTVAANVPEGSSEI